MELESNLANAYFQAYRKACSDLKACDPETITLNTNAIYDGNKNTLNLKYLDKDISVNCFDGDINCSNPVFNLTTTIKVLILHYLLHSRIKPLSGNLISFREIKGGGAIYYPTFRKRAIIPLIQAFGGNPEALYKAAAKLSGTRDKYGSASVTIMLFALVPVTYVIWSGDEEFPSSGTILFDDTVTNYLPVEDIVLAASFGVYELIRLSQEQQEAFV